MRTFFKINSPIHALRATVNGVEATPFVRRSLRERKDLAGAGVHTSASGVEPKAGGTAAGVTGSPFMASRTIRRRRPSTQSAYHAPSAAYRQGARAAYRTGCASTRVSRTA